MATASFADLRRAFPRPQTRITLSVLAGREDLVAGLASHDDVCVDSSALGLPGFARAIRDVRAAGFDLAVLFTNSLRTALVVGLAGVPLRVGLRKGGQEALLTHVVDAPIDPATLGWRPRPMSEIYADLCVACGAQPGDGRPRLAVPNDCEEKAAQRRRELGIAPGERLIGLAPGAAFGSSKVWPPAELARLADLLSRRKGLRSILLAGPGEEAIARDVVSRMQTTVIDTSAQPLGLGLLKPFVRDLALLVTMDSGPRHFAAAFDVPAVVVMGPTDPRWTASNLEHAEVVRHDVPCGPCQLPVCPLDHRCMTQIRAEEVLEHVEALESRLALSARSRRSP